MEASNLKYQKKRSEKFSIWRIVYSFLLVERSMFLRFDFENVFFQERLRYHDTDIALITCIFHDT